MKRFKSFAWRLGSYLAVSAVAFVGENVGLLELGPFWTTVIALICGELTKALNTKS